MPAGGPLFLLQTIGPSSCFLSCQKVKLTYQGSIDESGQPARNPFSSFNRSNNFFCLLHRVSGDAGGLWSRR